MDSNAESSDVEMEAAEEGVDRSSVIDETDGVDSEIRVNFQQRWIEDVLACNKNGYIPNTRVLITKMAKDYLKLLISTEFRNGYLKDISDEYESFAERQSQNPTSLCLDLNLNKLYEFSNDESMPRLLRTCAKTVYFGLVNFPVIVGDLVKSVTKGVLSALPHFRSPTPSSLNQNPGQSSFDSTSLYSSFIQDIKIRFHTLHQTTTLRSLSVECLHQMACVSGLVIKASEPMPHLIEACFECSECGKQYFQQLTSTDKIIPPSECTDESCRQSRGRMKGTTLSMKHDRSLYEDRQAIKLQELVEELEAGQTPKVLHCVVGGKEGNIYAVKPGDRVIATGIVTGKFKAKAPFFSRKVLQDLFLKLEVSHFKKIENTSENLSSDPNFTFDAEDEQAFYRTIASDPNLYENLANSIAPEIFEYMDVKKGLLCMLFGGSNVHFPEEARQVASGKKRNFTRGEINILLCGDPGTSKSQFLTHINNLSSRGMYTSGKGSSAVGLTAYISKDPETKQTTLEPGALVLSDLGICGIDEFDKMNDTTRAVLHEVMEQQTISVAKAGIVANLNSRVSILASANPIKSKYDPNLPIAKNINLPPTLMSRFDLIYLILDEPEPELDARLAEHICGIYEKGGDRATEEETTCQIVDVDTDLDSLSDGNKRIYTTRLFKRYVAYAKKSVQPRLTEEVQEELVQEYLAQRRSNRQFKTSSDRRRDISATTRQLESLVRLSESLAKMRLCSTVAVEDVKEASRLMQLALQKTATDPRTGLIDMSIISTGIGSSERQDLENLSIAVLEAIQEHEGDLGLTKKDLATRLKQGSWKVQQVIKSLEEDDKIFVEQSGNIRLL